MADQHVEQQPKQRAPWLKQHRFQRGRSGNPSGKPKGTPDDALKIRPIFEQVIRQHPKLVEQAIRGALAAPKERVPMLVAMRDSLDGKPAGQEETGPKVTVLIGMPAPRPEEMTVLVPSTSRPKTLPLETTERHLKR
jgi:hypothetical protein